MSKTKIDLTNLPIGTMVENREGEIGFYAGLSDPLDQAEGQPFNYYFASGEESFSYDGQYLLDEASDNDIVRIISIPLDESATKRIAELEKENADLVSNIPLVTDRTVAEAREKRKVLVAQIMAGFCANPSVFAHNTSCGWKLVNCDEDQLIDYANHLAGKIEKL